MLTRRLTSLIQQAGSSWGVTRRRSYPFSIHSIQQAGSSWGMTRRRSYPSSIQIIISFSIFIISISIQFIISFHFELSSWQACLGQSWLAAAFSLSLLAGQRYRKANTMIFSTHSFSTLFQQAGLSRGMTRRCSYFFSIGWPSRFDTAKNRFITSFNRLAFLALAQS